MYLRLTLFLFLSYLWKKLKPFEDIMQKDTLKNIKPWFFQFQGILDVHPPKQKVVLE